MSLQPETHKRGHTPQWTTGTACGSNPWAPWLSPNGLDSPSPDFFSTGHCRLHLPGLESRSDTHTSKRLGRGRTEDSGYE